jgi:hypothetical protein
VSQLIHGCGQLCDAAPAGESFSRLKKKQQRFLFWLPRKFTKQGGISKLFPISPGGTPGA